MVAAFHFTFYVEGLCFQSRPCAFPSILKFPLGLRSALPPHSDTTDVLVLQIDGSKEQTRDQGAQAKQGKAQTLIK